MFSYDYIISLLDMEGVYVINRAGQVRFLATSRVIIITRVYDINRT